MKRQAHKVQPTLEGLEDRKLLSNNGFGQTNQGMAQGNYALFTDPSTGQPYTNYGQLVSDFAHGNGIISGNNGNGVYNSSNPNDPGLSKVVNGTLPPGQS
jgi:hypothetical protein